MLVLKTHKMRLKKKRIFQATLITITKFRQKRLQTKNDKKKQKGHYVMMGGSTHQENKTNTNIYVPSTETFKSVKQKLS